MLTSYHRLGKKTSERALMTIRKELLRASERSLTDDSNDSSERLAAQRRFELYKDLADRQIQQILESMLTLKRVD